jgi:phage-related protein
MEHLPLSLSLAYASLALFGKQSPVRHTLSKHLENSIFELRVSFENRISRSFYFYESEKQIIFTHGFVKKGQKTPKSEIEKAISIRKLWRGGK